MLCPAAFVSLVWTTVCIQSPNLLFLFALSLCALQFSAAGLTSLTPSQTSVVVAAVAQTLAVPATDVTVDSVTLVNTPARRR